MPDTSAVRRTIVPSGVYLPGVLEDVVEHALDQRRIELDQRQIPVELDFHRVPDECRLRRLERAAHDLLERQPLPAELHFAALDARHVEQVVDERAHPARFVGDGLRGLELRTGRGRRGHRERFGQADQRGERRTQVVRERGEQRVAEPLGFHLNQRLLGHLDVMHALERDRGERGKRVELPLLLGDQQDPAILGLDREHAARAHRRAQRQVEERAAGEGIGAETRGLRLVVRPLRGADVHGERRAAIAAHGDPLLVVRDQHGRRPPGTSGR